jgi:predicted aspartyl protease
MSKTVIYPVERKDFLFYVRGAVGANDGRSKVVRLLVDTGARRTVLSLRLLREFGCVNEQDRKVSVIAAGGVIQVPLVKVPWFSCLGNQIDDFEVLGLDLPRSAEMDGLLGMDFLTQMNAIVDIKALEIRVKSGL